MILPKAMPIEKAKTQQLKGVVSGKLLSLMRREAVECPVKGEVVPFIECFSCSNFLRRVKGKVNCKGKPLEDNDSV
jgi:hypothetical protein